MATINAAVTADPLSFLDARVNLVLHPVEQNSQFAQLPNGASTG